MRLVSSIVLAAAVTFPAILASAQEPPSATSDPGNASGHFRKYEPESPRSTAGQRVATSGVRLLTSQDDLENRVDVSDLAAFIKRAEGVAYKTLDANKAAAFVVVLYECVPGKCTVTLGSRGDAESAVLQSLYEALVGLPPLQTRGEMRFQIELEVRS